MSNSYGMSPARLRLAHAIIAVLVGSSIYHALADRERWPFCSYKMFCESRAERTLTWLWVFGVTDEAQPREIPLLSSDYIAPMDQSRLSRSLWRIQQQPDHQARFEGALANTLARYDARRRAGKHHGPALQGARLYELYWTLDPHAANVDHPDRRTLLAEIAMKDQGPRTKDRGPLP